VSSLSLTNLVSLCTKVGLEFPDDSSASVNGGNSDMQSVGGGGNSRNRAYSFECFAFGINADEPLPPLEQSTSNAALVYNGNNANGASVPQHRLDLARGRPRGDSIIFDPVSFQDGGILEQHALVERSPATVPKEVTTDVPIPPTIALQPSTATFKAAFPDCNESTGDTSNAAAVAASTTAALTLELLNKDGRIGIYLPDARRARIARFHAKRSKRIWRKRIKYDCRKKLADSRPRIKGRFVKRSDMDDDF
jgi:CCT motif